ncbi:hypothetical protein [Kitasatospora sp. NPDC127116]|uniref:hypothetical protein n=1 Tax=Kitasatospora sp. NPDC127116 TaxID=3345367 RepID=UPI0036381662
MPNVAVAHLPERDLLVAEAPDRRSAQLLEQAGLVRDDALGLHRFRRDTPPETAKRQLREARRLLFPAEYGFTRVYSEAEQYEATQRRNPLTPPGPVLTATSRAPAVHHVSTDIANGHMVLLAHHESPYEATELLGLYPASGKAATFYTEGGGYYGASRHPDLDSALAEWSSQGYATEAPIADPRRRAALLASRAAAGRTKPLPATPSPISVALTVARRNGAPF